MKKTILNFVKESIKMTIYGMLGAVALSTVLYMNDYYSELRAKRFYDYHQLDTYSNSGAKNLVTHCAYIESPVKKYLYEMIDNGTSGEVELF